MSTSPISQAEFKLVADFLKRRSGLSINYDKLYLLESRLHSVLKEHEIMGLNGLVAQMRKGVLTAELADAVTEAMTTNETMFFRDQKPFQQLRDIVLPALLARKPRGLRIWCAACSQGQEPYSVAMVLDEKKAELELVQVDILGTDIAKNVLKKARRGLYTQFEVQRGLPITFLMKYFTQAANNQWQISEAMRAKVRFEEGNLLESRAPIAECDIVMCRNVLIYFDDTTKTEVLSRIAKAMRVGGYLFLGSSETMIGLSEAFKPVEKCPGLFTRVA